MGFGCQASAVRNNLEPEPTYQIIKNHQGLIQN